MDGCSLEPRAGMTLMLILNDGYREVPYEILSTLVFFFSFEMFNMKIQQKKKKIAPIAPESSFIHQFSDSMLSAYYLPSTALHTGDRSKRPSRSLLEWGK